MWELMVNTTWRISTVSWNHKIIENQLKWHAIFVILERNFLTLLTTINVIIIFKPSNFSVGPCIYATFFYCKTILYSSWWYVVDSLWMFQIISLNTTLVLNDKNFEDVEQSTLLAILDCDKLNISSELELLSAVYRWAVQECSRQGEEGIL